MKVRYELDTKQLDMAFKRLGGQSAPILHDAVEAGIRVLQREVLAAMNAPKSGRAYRVSRTGALHVAAAPGEAPAVETANLAISIAQGARVTEATNTQAEAVLEASTPYAAHLEYGTSRMAARPYFRTTLDAKQDAIRQAIERELQRGVEKAWRS